MDMNLKSRFSELGLEEDQLDLIDRNLDIPRIGDAHFDSPLKFSVGGKQDEGMFVPENERVLAILDRTIVDEFYRTLITPPSFEKAGPRKKLYFQPGETVSAVVTCGGLCPGLNAVVRSIVMMNYYRYGNQRTYGIRYGYAGLVKKIGYEVPLLGLKNVDGIHAVGGSILGSSRGPQSSPEMVDRLEELGVNVLYTIGGDGTQRGALDIIKEIEKRNLKISVVGIPKTIDNDIMHIDKSFGMETAFSKACDAIYSAHTEAEASLNGIGIVKLMGRESGFIAANATLATNEGNFCLVPEVDFDLDGPCGLLAQLEERFHSKKHAVIVVAEGAGQKFAANPGLAEKDASGNSKLGDIGLYLQKAIKKHFTEKKVECSIKYMDPCYIIRSVAPTPNDSIFCAQLAQMAVHAGMSGRSNLLIGYTNGQFVHLPIDLCISRRKKIDPHGQLWLSVLEATGQPASMKNNT